MHKNITAYTGSSQDKPYPEFISINKEDDGMISVYVRSESKFCSTKGHHVEGSHGFIKLTPEQFNKLKADINKE